MRSVNMKIYIVTIICSTVTCQTAQYYGNPGGIIFPGPVVNIYNEKIKYNTSPPPSPPCTNCRRYLSTSLELAKELNELESYDDFFNFIGNKSETGRETLLAIRSGNEHERTQAIESTSGKCKPALEIVPFRDSSGDPTIFYYPSCTRINRCSGCCNTDYWSCQATNQTMQNFIVFRNRINTDGKIWFLGEEIIPLEEHTTCKCQCKTKAQDCSPKQKYIEDECSCVCANTDEQEKCKTNYVQKWWDSEACACLCRKEEECTTGYYFDGNTCSCTKIENFRVGELDYHHDKQTNIKIESTQRTPYSSITLSSPSATDPRRKHKDEE